MRTCHIVLLRTDLHLSFVDILDYSNAANKKKSGIYWVKHKMGSPFFYSYLKSPAVNLASAKEKAASLITSPILVFVWKKRVKFPYEIVHLCCDIEKEIRNWMRWTHFDNFTEYLTEPHGEGIRFLLEKVAAGLSPFKSSLHDGLSPATKNK